MTENTLNFSTSDETKSWLENQTSAVLFPVHDQAKKLRDDMNLAIRNVEDVSKMLFDISSREIEKRNMKVYNRARALNKLSRLFLDRLKKLNPPEEISYASISRYVQETQKIFFVTDIDLKNWFPRISPFFIMDRRKFLAIYEKAKQAYNALNNFVNDEYVKTRNLEEALIQLNELQDLEKQLESLGADRESIKAERLPLEQEIAQLEQKIGELQRRGPIDKLNMVNAEIDSLSNELKNELRHLQKPFIKMQALATGGGGGGITPDDLSQINVYLDKPFDAIVSDKPGYPRLREVLEKLEVMLAEDKLKIKPDKARKAEQSVNEILHKNSLAKLQLRCVEMAINREQLLESSKMDEIKQNISQFQDQIDQLAARKTSVETHETVKENRYKETLDKISNLKRTIERNVNAALEVKIQIA